MNRSDHRQTDTQDEIETRDETQIHVLHVDDDEAYSHLVQRWFERTHDDMVVTVEVDPTRALSRLEHGTPIDAVISDYRMPEMTGVELLGRIRERRPNLPFVMLTGEGSESIAMEAIHAGVTDYFRKHEAGEGFALLIERVRSLVLERRATVESQRFGTLLEMLDVPVAVFDADGRIRAANQRVDELIPTSAGGGRIERIQDLVADDERGLVADYVETLRGGTGPNVVSAELGIVTDGGAEPYRIQMAAVPGREENPDGILAIIKPREGKQFEATLGDLLEWTTGPYVTVDHEWRIVLVNDAAQRLLGRRERALVGHDLWEVFPAFEDATFHDQLRSVVEHGVPLDVETYYAPSGTHFHVRAYQTSKGVAIYLQDVTVRVERERELARRAKRLREFVSIVSHDLRNPLSVAIGYVDTLVADGDHDAETVEIVRQSLERAETIIAQTLRFAEEGEVDELVPVDFESMAETAWEGVATADATLEVESSVRLRADPDALVRVLENLFRNAIEHGSTTHSTEDDADASHGTPTVSVVVGSIPAVDTTVGFYVEDDGPGIPPDRRETVFETAYSTSDTGTGFGLAIVEQISDAHGWSISAVEGTAGGARFEFTGIDPVIDEGLTAGNELTGADRHEEVD
ncbi:ATP-binding protein [Salinigranum salinum]|uniref:ATP-binding protein n=1 Tax=Salinigranum salinum TaxID=1364937 RepID=UPI00186557D0|nr:ATP-binding protein [Salinigranum salinum]